MNGSEDMIVLLVECVNERLNADAQVLEAAGLSHIQ